MSDSFTPMKPRTFTVLVRGVVYSFTAAMLVAVVALVRKDWFGAVDLGGFWFFTGVFSVAVALVGLLAFRLLARLPRWMAYSLGGTLGLVVGYLFALGNRLFLGPWFGAWSIPVTLAWLGGGLVGMAAAAGTRPSPKLAWGVLEAVGFVSVLAALYIGLPWVVKTATHDQRLTLVYGRLYPGGSTVEIEDPRGILYAEDKELIRRAPLRGRVVVRGSHSRYSVRSPDARVLVFLSGPVSDSVRLPEPYSTDLLYWQDGHEFQHYPQSAETLNRSVELFSDGARSGVTKFWVEAADGSKSGADMLHWDEEP